MPQAIRACFKIHAFQLAYSLFFLLSLLPCYHALLPLKLSSTSSLFMLLFLLYLFNSHLTSFTQSISAVSSSTLSYWATRIHRGENTPTQVLLSREQPMQPIAPNKKQLAAAIYSEVVPVWFTTLPQQLLKWHN